MPVVIDERAAVIAAGLERMLKIALDQHRVVISMSDNLMERVVVVDHHFDPAATRAVFDGAIFAYYRPTRTGTYESWQVSTAGELQAALNRHFPDELLWMMFQAGELESCNHYREVRDGLPKIVREITPGWALVRSLDRLAGALAADQPMRERAPDVEVGVNVMAQHFADQLAGLSKT